MDLLRRPMTNRYLDTRVLSHPRKVTDLRPNPRLHGKRSSTRLDSRCHCDLERVRIPVNRHANVSYIQQSRDFTHSFDFGDYRGAIRGLENIIVNLDRFLD